MFVPGQRWISSAEPELGLGTVLRVERRGVQLLFAKSGVLRQYAQQSAPLVRASFRAGQQVRGQGLAFTVERVREEDGIRVYLGAGHELAEGALDDEQSVSQADDRLSSGRVDPADAFDLRVEALQRRADARRSAAWGIASSRVELLPHQLRVVEAVAVRRAPRVLLADEVGLGKTIEAGMIVARQLAAGRANRVLVVLPENLVHQWFVELLRRFNLAFAIYDEERAAAIEAGGEANPFEDEQRVIVSLGFLQAAPQRAAQVLAAGWDLLLVDEAHHLEWSPEAASPAYALVEQLARATPGVVLLTATPEQLGRSGHFARLRLLDPARYHDLDAYRAEADSYRPLSRIAGLLQAGETLGDAECEALRQRFPRDEALHQLLDAYAGGPTGAAATNVLSALIDRHGTGRVMFRNRRAAIGGFPQRVPHVDLLAAGSGDESLRQALLAEFHADIAEAPTDFEPALGGDPRLAWLLMLLARYPDDKFLLICRSRAKVQALEAALKPSGIKLARFHETLGLLQRDRNAAWFAEADGARLLLCSEIGSEGRNFQFAHRLVLWDLPLDPDLLEQRIGRLDRIGRGGHDIDIHVGVVQGSAQHLLARWYDEALDAFRASPADGRELLRRFGEVLRQLAVQHAAGNDEVDQEFDALLAEGRAVHQALSADIHAGRDRLLELSSQRAGGDVLEQALREGDADAASHGFAQRLLERFGVDVEELGAGVLKLDPEYLSTESLSGFEGGPISVTFDRDLALRRDDLPLLRFDHPLLLGALDLLLSSEAGNAAFMVDAALAPRQALLEAVFVLECVADAGLDVERFLPPMPLRVVVDTRQREVPNFAPSADAVRRALAEPIDVARYQRVLLRLLPPMLASAETFAHAGAAREIDRATRAADTRLEARRNRLTALMQVNPGVSEADVLAVQAERQALREALAGSRLRLDALRCVVSPDFLALR
ncbi:MAG TPA: RNA polymerase-associated protein RapA [Rhodanobacteraceae bacterium]|nr:RNA polymerase-associated protein RapA [Rhodanobacteraceae bacterium]